MNSLPESFRHSYGLICLMRTLVIWFFILLCKCFVHNSLCFFTCSISVFQSLTFIEYVLFSRCKGRARGKNKECSIYAGGKRRRRKDTGKGGEKGERRVKDRPWQKAQLLENWPHPRACEQHAPLTKVQEGWRVNSGSPNRTVPLILIPFHWILGAVWSCSPKCLSVSPFPHLSLPTFPIAVSISLRFVYVNVYFSAHMYVHHMWEVSSEIRWGHWMSFHVLGTEPKSSAGAVSAVNYWGMSPVLKSLLNDYNILPR